MAILDAAEGSQIRALFAHVVYLYAISFISRSVSDN
jgi:hypothetical protein